MRIKWVMAASCAGLLATTTALAADETEEASEIAPEENSVETEAAVEASDLAEEDSMTVEAEAEPDRPRDKAIARREQRKEEREDIRKRLEAYGADRSRWRFATAAAIGRAEVDITDVDIKVPEDFLIEDLEVAVTDVTEISSTAWIASVGYRIFPFLEVSGQMGIIQSETVAAFEVTGTPQLERITFDEPITISLDNGSEADGFTYGLGANTVAPVGLIAGRPVLGVAGVRYNWNRVDDGAINSETLFANFGLAYVVPTEEALYSFSLGTGYGRLERESTREAAFAGEEIRIRTQQELDNPWSIDIGLSRSLGKNWTVGYGASANMSGPISHGISLSFTPSVKSNPTHPQSLAF